MLANRQSSKQSSRMKLKDLVCSKIKYDTGSFKGKRFVVDKNTLGTGWLLLPLIQLLLLQMANASAKKHGE